MKEMYARDYRAKAASIIKPISGDFAVVYLVAFVISGAIGALTFINQYAGPVLVSLITLFTAGAFEFGLIYMSKNAHSKHIKPKVGDYFSGFKRFAQALGVSVVTSIFILLWTLLLIVPGIIKSFSYSQAMFIAHDNPDMTTLDCITKSREMMDGKKWRLFCLEISYIGWMLLVVLTLGILSFWVMPKYHMARYEFYLNNKKSK